MTRAPCRLPSSQVLRAVRRFAGIGLEMSLQRAVRIVTTSLEQGIEMPCSGVLDVGRLALDSAVNLDRDTRFRAARAVSIFRELETIKRAIHVVGSDETPLDVVEAAAVILLGPPARRLSRKTSLGLRRCVRRYGQIRGPITDLVLLAARSGKLPSKGKK